MVWIYKVLLNKPQTMESFSQIEKGIEVLTRQLFERFHIWWSTCFCEKSTHRIFCNLVARFRLFQSFKFAFNKLSFLSTNTFRNLKHLQKLFFLNNFVQANHNQKFFCYQNHKTHFIWFMLFLFCFFYIPSENFHIKNDF